MTESTNTATTTTTTGDTSRALLTGAAAKLTGEPIVGRDALLAICGDNRFGRTKPAIRFGGDEYDAVRAGRYIVGNGFSLRVTMLNATKTRGAGFRIVPVWNDRAITKYSNIVPLCRRVFGKLMYGPAVRRAGYVMNVVDNTHIDITRAVEPATPDATPDATDATPETDATDATPDA